jgi:hypothetical protein
MSKYVIIHQEFGIYVGHALGLGFWSKLDSVGQSQVPVFETLQSAQDHVRDWVDFNDPEAYTFPEVSVDSSATYATVAELRSAGLEPYLGELFDHLATHAAPSTVF